MVSALACEHTTCSFPMYYIVDKDRLYETHQEDWNTMMFRAGCRKSTNKEVGCELSCGRRTDLTGKVERREKF